MLAVARRVPPTQVLPVVGLLAVALLALGPDPSLIGFVWLAAVTPRLVETDLAEHRLPDAVVLPGYPVVLSSVLLCAWSTGSAPLDAIVAGAACGLVFLLLHVAGGMGFGDVKLAPLLGALAAVAAPGGALLWLVAAFLLGGAGAAVVLIRRGVGARLAFGPPMLLAAWALLLVA